MKGSKILLVDDATVFSDNMSKLLTNRGYHVCVVNSGDEAVTILDKETFDVIVLDLKMPGMGGITTLREIKRMDLYTEVLVLTGHGSIDSAMEAVRLGAYDYLTKPCEINELVAKIEGAWVKKGDKEQKDVQEKIQRVIESPSSVFKLFPREK